MNDFTQESVGQNIDALLKEMEARTITTDEDYSFTAEWLKRLKGTQKIVGEVFDPEIAHLRAPYQEKLDEKKMYLTRLEQGERIAKRKMGEYAEEKRRLAEEERKRIEAKNRADEEERRLNEAITTGDESVLDEPVPLPPPVEVPAAPEVKGIVYVETWKYEIVNPIDLPREYLVPNDKAIQAVVSALNGKAVIPGIRVYSERVIRAGRA